MTSFSILFDTQKTGLTEEGHLERPGFFTDLNLDQIVDGITSGKKEYDLLPFYYGYLRDLDTIRYRHEIFRDLENQAIFDCIESFSEKMQTIRAHHRMIDNLYYKLHKLGWFLATVEIYCDAVNHLANDLQGMSLTSRGLLDLRDYLMSYADSVSFRSLIAETKRLKADLSSVKYCLLIKGNSITVRKYESEIDLSPVVENTFERFRQGEAKEHAEKVNTGSGMNHVEAQILDFVAALYPDIFSSLQDYCLKNRDYMDKTISVFDREIQFYAGYLEYISILKKAGLEFCYPQLAVHDKEIYVSAGFDLALARQLTTEGSSVVCNDFYMKERERIFVVSGPNQGGKTTFARFFGQLHYLAGIGCPVPGRKARLFLYDRLFTHFEKEENINNLRGKLQDDMLRIHHILSQATENSIIIMNEIFTSTTLQDAVFLGKKVMEKIMAMDSLCVCVTFIDEWASLSEKTVSMVSAVCPGNPASRTYKIERRDADGLSYALSIAEKYRLTYDLLKERIKP